MSAPASACVGIDEPFAKGMGDQFGGVARSGLAHDAGAVSVDGLGADPQSLTNFAIGSPAHDLAQDLPLAVGQRFNLARFFEHFGKAAAHDPCAFEDPRDRADDLAHVIGFAKDPVCADVDEFSDLAARIDASEDDHSGFGRPAARLEQNLGPARMGHGHIKHQQMGPVLAHSDYRLDPVFDRLDDVDLLPLKRVFIAQGRRKRIANDRVVIGNDRRADPVKSAKSAARMDQCCCS